MQTMYSDTAPGPETNLRSLDRILSLAVIDNKLAKSSTGLTDSRLFTGKQQLHITMDPQTNLWSFRYTQNALLPEGLQGQFTSFTKAYDHAASYFLRRNIRITEVKD
jgi:hypothetical protein